MTIRFEALPVGRGDSFLLRNGNTAVLFDGGQSLGQVARFLEFKELTQINAVICSHNDSDHANGLFGVLESRVEVEEVWLPVYWIEFVHAVLEQDESWPLRLLNEVKGSEHGVTNLEDIYNKMDRGYEGVYQDEEVGIEAEHVMDTLADCEANYDSIIHWPVNWFCYPIIHNGGLFESAVLAGERIRRLLSLAYHRGCRVRFFQYETGKRASVFNRYGFTTMNAVEVAWIRKPKSLLRILALTQANRESLVFWHEIDGAAFVLFTADSDLQFLNGQPLQTTASSIVTAPHHGSADNKSVYSLVLGNSLIWVRSDMKAVRRPCPEFRQQHSKFCTICARFSQTKQGIEVEFVGGVWKPASNTRPCQCP